MPPIIVKFERWNWGRFFAGEFWKNSAKCGAYIHCLPQLQFIARKYFDREVNTLKIKAFEVPPNSKIGWDISQKLQVLGDLSFLLNVLLF